MRTTLGFDAGATGALSGSVQEPLHIPGTIQPRGVLLALNEHCETVLIASENASAYFGRDLSQLVGQPAIAVLGEARLLDVRALMKTTRDRVVVPVPSRVPVADRAHTVLAHRTDGRVIVEIIAEAVDATPDIELAAVMVAVSRAQRSSVQPLSDHEPARPRATPVFERVAAVPPLEADFARMFRRTADEVRRFTGYDRVMVYRFAGDAYGTVIAESRRPSLESLLGLHFPASDIQPEARALYVNTRVHVLESVSQAQSPLVAAPMAAAQRPLDMSSALLRSAPSTELEYLRKMGVEATLAVSIVVDERLWGLIICHHLTPKWPSLAMRTAFDMLSEFVSVQVAVHETYARARARSDANAAHGVLIRQLLVSSGRLDGAIVELMALIDCGGVAVVSGSEVHLAGRTPSALRVRDVTNWLSQFPRVGHMAALDNLSRAEASFTDISDVASGVLALDIGSRSDAVVIWFRPEESQAADDADRTSATADDPASTSRRSARGSFSDRLDERHAHATGWTADELVMAEAIRSAFIEVGLELHETKLKLARLEYARVHAAVDAASDGIAITDADGRTIYVNTTFTALTGFRVEDISDPRELFAITPGGNDDLIPDRSDSDVVAISSTGMRIPVALRIDTIADDDGQPAGTMFLITDQRPKRALADERKRLALRLAESQRLESLGIMAGGVAHDFNNLLTTISGNAGIARADLAATDAVEESLDAIDTAVEHASGLCRQLLAYSGKGRSVLLPINMNSLLADLIRLLQRSISSVHTIEMHLSVDLPMIDGDKTQLRQVIMNLIINGSEAMGILPGRIDVGTSVVTADAVMRSTPLTGETLPAGDYVEIRVTDSGSGMDSETMTRIFDPFFSTKFAGRGLGLASAQGIVAGHHGGLRVASTPGIGTTFTILLPISPADVEPNVTPPPATTTLPIGTKTILLVDDDVTVRDTVRRLLERRKFIVIPAVNGQTALEIFTAQPDHFDMIVSDVSMPVMDGVALLQRLRADGYKVPVLLFSGYSVADVGALIAEDVHSRFVEKPFSVDVLDGAMADLFQRTAV